MRHEPIDRAGFCGVCGREVRQYGPRLEHRRGRIRGVSPFRGALGRPELERRLREIDRPGYCDCGRPLEGHPPLPRPKPLSSGRAHDRGIRW